MGMQAGAICLQLHNQSCRLRVLPVVSKISAGLHFAMTPTQYHLLQQTVAYIRPAIAEVSLAMFKKMEEFVPETELDTASRWRASVSMLEIVLSPQLSSKLMVPITNADPMKLPPGLINVS